MSRIKSNWYTKGKFDRKIWRNTIDTENEFLYSKGRYPTKIKEKNLPKDYAKIQSRTIWYMTGFVRTSGVKDLYYTYIKENHLFKDDYLYISYDKKIEKLKGKKILIRGNHDKKSREFFRKVGFGFIPESPLKLNNEKLILSHKPLKDAEIPKGYVNVHGHIHNNPLHKINPTTNEMEYPESLYSEELHMNVSADVIDFKPISLKELLEKVEKKKIERGNT